jgi:hypothetical protein
MPVYFFHVKHFESVDEDLEGVSFETLDEARSNAAETLRGLSQKTSGRLNRLTSPGSRSPTRQDLSLRWSRSRTPFFPGDSGKINLHSRIAHR